MEHNTRVQAGTCRPEDTQTVDSSMHSVFAPMLQTCAVVSVMPTPIHNTVCEFLSKLHTQGICESSRTISPFFRLRELLLMRVANILERETQRTHFKMMGRERVQVSGIQWPLIMGKSRYTSILVQALITCELALTSVWGGIVCQTNTKAIKLSNKSAINWAK